MKTTLYMAITLNGMIAEKDGNSEWVSKEDTDSFLSICNSIGAVIMGRHTYDYLTKGDAKEGLPLTKGVQVVMTSDKTITSNNPTVLFTDLSPKNILSMLAEKGYKKVCVMGGATTATTFMKEGLVDEIYFDIEPLLFGAGIQLFTNSNFEYQLQLLDTKKLNENTIQVHYKVNK